MNKNIMAWGVIFALTAVILDSFGAHALKEYLSSNQLDSFKIGVRYQMYHGLALLFIGFNFDKIQNTPLISKLFINGTLLFSVSIYLINLQEIIGASLSFLGPMTPTWRNTFNCWVVYLFINNKKNKMINLEHFLIYSKRNASHCIVFNV